MNSNENDEPYEVVVKHDLIGVLHNASFQTLNQAYAYLRACWAKLPVDRDINIQFGGAIYDKHNSWERVLAFGADYLTEENGGNASPSTVAARLHEDARVSMRPRLWS
jgi:hypothetical protein